MNGHGSKTPRWSWPFANLDTDASHEWMRRNAGIKTQEPTHLLDGAHPDTRFEEAEELSDKLPAGKKGQRIS